MKTPERAGEGVVLVVDDIPENLSFLHDALDEAGYTVLVATDGPSALHRAKLSRPDVILLDALMPRMSGFEVARRLKEDFSTQHVPIIFMTGLTETEHVINAFASGGSDYVTKPIKPPEVLARIAAHMQSARHMSQARSALDAFGQATVALRETDGQLTWQTPLARKLLKEFFDPEEGEAEIVTWFSKARKAALEGREMPVVVAKGTKRLLAGVQNLSDAGHEGEWLIVLREESPSSVIESLVGAFHLTLREAEVLYWVICGKTNRDIGEILGSSHRTVNKHLEHIFEKLGVETRTAAAGIAMQNIRSRPSREGTG